MLDVIPRLIAQISAQHRACSYVMVLLTLLPPLELGSLRLSWSYMAPC